MRYLVLLVSLALSVSAQAEIYQGIEPYSTLGDLKGRFPNATVKKVDAAWVTKSDGFYLMEGPGLAGRTYVAFNDHRPRLLDSKASAERKLELLQQMPESTAKTEEVKVLSDSIKFFSHLSSQTDDAAMIVRWVRWIPEDPIPVSRYISKYGVPTNTDFSESTMQPYSEWSKRGLRVMLSDDQKFVYQAEFEFTPQERYAACRARFGSSGTCKKP